MTTIARDAFRSVAIRAPWLYNWRNRHIILEQRIRRRGIHDDDLRCLASIDVDEPLVLDVGGNVGQSILTIKTLLPSARIKSFEPAVRLVPQLLKVADRYGQTVQIGPFAISDRHGVLTLSTPVVGGAIFSQYSTVEVPDRARWARDITAAGFGTIADTDVRVEEQPCAVVPLDSVAETCHVLKIDVEGHEDAVIAGARDIIERSRPVLIVERPSAYVSMTLRADGYEQHAGGYNVIFVHPDNALGVTMPDE